MLIFSNKNIWGYKFPSEFNSSHVLQIFFYGMFFKLFLDKF